MNKMTDSHILSLNTQAILLLCGVFGLARPNEPKPLNLSEYNSLAQWLRDLDMRPSDLLDEEGTRRILHSKTNPLDVDRMLALMARGASMAFAVESWTNKGLWVLSRVDDDYPKRLKDRLKRSAPPILYGSGRKELLRQGGMAIVGSRNIDEEALRFTNLVAESCAAHRIAVISGGARGVDSEAMGAALKKGGTVVGVLAKGLAQEASSKKFRDAIMAGTLVLLSPFHPHAAFNVGNAMGRNKYIYALSDWAVVINSGLGEGGTWAGATENLKHKWVPLFVRSGQVPEGNIRLVESGGIPLPENVLREGLDLRSWLEDQSVVSGMAELQSAGMDFIPDGPIPIPVAPLDSPNQAQKQPVNAGETAPTPADLFNVVWPCIEAELRSAKTSKELAGFFNVTQSQMTSWLNQATEIGKASKLKNPERYIVPSQDLIPDSPIPIPVAPLELPDQAQKPPEDAGEAAPTPADLFNVVWPYIEAELRSAKTSKDLAAPFNVNQRQMTSWLNHATKIGKASKLKDPVRYIVPSQEAGYVGRQLTLPFKKPGKGKDTGVTKT